MWWFFLKFKTEWHLIEVNHKRFFPGWKYRTIKVSPREKAWRNQGVKPAPSCQAEVPVSPKGLGLPAAIPARHVPHHPSHSQALSLQSCFFSEAQQTSCPFFPGQLWRLRIIFPCLQSKTCSSWLSFPCFASDGSTPPCRNGASSGMVCHVLPLYWPSPRNREKLHLHPAPALY